jgi:hypothetical protein
MASPKGSNNSAAATAAVRRFVEYIEKSSRVCVTAGDCRSYFKRNVVKC